MRIITYKFIFDEAAMNTDLIYAFPIIDGYEVVQIPVKNHVISERKIKQLIKERQEKGFERIKLIEAKSYQTILFEEMINDNAYRNSKGPTS